MSTSSLTQMWTSFSGMAGGGVYGKVVGIAHIITTGAGVITTDVPSFYFDVDPGWRGYYRDHNWYGHRWNYERIPQQRLQQNWKGWQNNRHWERQGTWGVQGYQPRPQQKIQELRQQRQQQYQQRPEVQQQRQPQGESPAATKTGAETSGPSSQNNNLGRKFSSHKNRSRNLRFGSQTTTSEELRQTTNNRSRNLRFRSQNNNLGRKLSNQNTLSLRENLIRERKKNRTESSCDRKVQTSKGAGPIGPPLICNKEGRMKCTC